jgi:hypothetical protein
MKLFPGAKEFSTRLVAKSKAKFLLEMEEDGVFACRKFEYNPTAVG